MRIASPSTAWTTAQTSSNKIIQWKVYARKVTTLTESLTSGTSFTEVTNYIKEFPSISQAIELETGQFTSDSFDLNCNNINYWITNWLDLSSAQQLEIKVTCNLSLSGTSFTTDTPILASGFADKMSFSLNENDDSVNFTVQSYDEYANRITGKNLTFQKTRTNINSTGLTVLVCNKMPGVYIYTASPYLNLQTLNFKWDTDNSVYQVKYNDGEFTSASVGSSGLLSLRDAKNNLAQVYILYNELEKYEIEQKFIFRNSSDTLPYLFYDDATVSELLTAVTNEFPVNSTSITAPSFTPYDSGYRLTSLENIVNTNGNAVAKCIEWDATNNLLWIGVGGKLYSRTTGGTWTLKATATEGRTIKRIWVDVVSSGYIWLLLTSDEVSDNYYFGKFTTASLAFTEIDTTRLASGDLQLGYSSFSIHSTGIYYSRGTNFTQTIKYINFADDIVYTYGSAVNSSYTVQINSFAFYTILYGFYCQVNDGGVIKFYNQNGSVGNLITDALPSAFYNAIAIPSGANIIIYFTASTGYIYKYLFNAGGLTGTLTQISTEITAYGFYKSSTSIYFYGNGVKSSSIYYPFAYLNTSTDAITTVSNLDIKIPNIDYDVRLGQLVYVSGVIYLITNTGRFFQFNTSISNRINETWDTSSISVRDALNELCKIYNLIYVVRPNKSLVLFSRSDSAGAIQNNGSATKLSVTASNLINVNDKLGGIGKATKVKIVSGDILGDYNGTSYDTFDADDEKIVEISSELIQHSGGLTLRDMAKHFYPFYSRGLNVLSCSFASVPGFQYEVTDGAEIDLSGTKINIGSLISEGGLELITEGSVELSIESSTGIIQKQTINQDGSMEVEVLI